MTHTGAVGGEPPAAGATSMQPSRSYVIACTPRVGSHLLANALAATRIAGQPRERFPRLTADTAPATAVDRMRLVTQAPPEESYDPVADAEYVREVLAQGTSGNGVFGVVIHWFQVQDAVRRLQAYLDTRESAPHRVLSAAFPNLSYIWLKRRDRVAQAVSWYKSVQTGTYVGRHAGEGEPLRFDYPKIKYLHSAITSFENAWGSFFSSNRLTPLVLYYEDLSARYADTVRAVLDFLQLDAGGVDIAAPRHEKYADAQSLAWIDEFRRVQGQARSAR